MFAFTGGSAGDSAFVEWFDPTGKLYITNTLQIDSSPTHCSAYYIGILGFTPASTPGSWRVHLRVNSTEVFSKSFTIAQPPVSQLALITNTTLPEATVGAPYSVTLQASGGQSPYTYTLTTGQAPPGLTLSSAGVLSGTPTGPGSYLMSLRVSDSAGASLTRDIALGVGLPALQPGVGSLSFSYTSGAAVPPAQSFPLTSNASALSYTVSTDQSWLSATPPSGSTPGTVNVAVQPQNLAPGSYQGNVIIQARGAIVPQQTVPVSLAVLAQGTGTPGGIIRTVVGTDWTFTIPSGKGVNAPLGQVYGIAPDSAGNLFIADYDNNVVVKLTPGGNATVVAGNGLAGFSGDGGLAVNASLKNPQSVAVDSSGNLFIADTGNNRIRKVSTDGTITTIGGTGTAGYFGDGGPAVNALIDSPRAIVLDSAGNVYFFDSDNVVIREIAGNGRIVTVAGNGKTGYSGEALVAGEATTVATDVTYQMVFDALGNLYFGDNQSHVRRLTPAGTTQLIAGTGTKGFSGDGGPASSAQLNRAYGLAFDRAGNLLIGDFNNGRIRQVTPSGTISTFAGSGNINTSGDNGPASKAGMNPFSLAVTNDGVYVADYTTNTIRKIDAASSIITTVAGNGKYKTVPDGTPALNSYIDVPDGLAFDRSGNMIVADYFGQRIVKITPSGAFSTIAGIGTSGCCGTGKGDLGEGGPATSALMFYPNSVAVDAQNNIYFADSQNHRVRRIGTDGNITTVAGAGYFADSGVYTKSEEGGQAVNAHLKFPRGIAIDANGNLYIADAGNSIVRKVTPAGIITTVAGTPLTPGFKGDGGQATAAQLSAPAAVTLDAGGNLYIADALNHSIRMVTPAGVISTVAGNQQAGSSGDGGPAKSASLNYPLGVLVDAAGTLYITENTGNRIRQVSNGIITTIAGTGVAGFSGDGGPSPAAQLRFPAGTFALQNGTLYFTDDYNFRVRAISLAAAPATSAPTLSTTPTTLSFAAVSNGGITNKSNVAINSSSPGLPVQIAASTSTGGGWLQVDATSATCPATIGVSANAAGLAAGSYRGTVTISSPYANPPQVTIDVTFTVNAATAGHLNTDTTPLSFKVVNGASPVTAQLMLSNTGSGSLPYTVSTSTAAGGPWLAVTPSNGTASASSPASLTITLTPSSLAAGVYSGTVTVSSPANSDPPLVIPVTLLVGNPVPAILVSQTGLTFQAVQGGGNPLPQDISILNVGQGVMNWTATAQTLSGGSWLSISPASGTVTTPFTGFSTTSISIDTSGLAPNNYFGQIQVRADGANNSPQTISIVLNVFPTGTVLSPEVRPSGLVFIGSKDNPPGSQTVSIANRGTTSFSYNSSKGTFSNVNWIANAPVAGTVPINFPTRMTVQPDLSQRTPGVDRGVITVLFNDGSNQTVSILSVVPPPGYTPSSEPGQIRDAASLSPHASGGCQPGQLLVQMSNPASNNAQLPFGQPVSIELHMTDDCGNAVSDKYPASVNVSFSTNEPGIAMQYVGSGRWTKTWQPRSTQPGTVIAHVTGLASAANGKIIATDAFLNFNLVSVAQVPQVNPDGIKNAANYSTTPVVSPGGLVAIYGSQLSDPTGQVPPPGTVPTSLGHTQVKLGDALLPLFYTSGNQLNAQVPFNLPVNSQQHLVVQYGNSLSVPAPVSVAAAQPAIFSQDLSGTGQGSIVNGVTNILADPKNPVHAGDVISIYCTGLGPVNPPQPEGTVASLTVLSQTVTPVTATIGGQSASVAFAGLAPGLVGVYQVNVVVPSGVSSGDSVPVVLTEGSQVSTPVTIAVR